MELARVLLQLQELLVILVTAAANFNALNLSRMNVDEMRQCNNGFIPS